MGATAGIVGAISAVGTIAGGLASANAQREAGNYQRDIYNYNAQVASAQARNAEERGAAAAVRQTQTVRRVIGAQRAALGAQGLDPNAGSSLDVTGGTALMGELDALTIRNNAALEAWGFRAQAAGDEAQARMAKRAGTGAAAGTILTTGARAYDIFRKPTSSAPVFSGDGQGGFLDAGYGMG